MSIPTKPPLDWREIRRLKAWELHQQGWSQSMIAAELGVTQGAVSQWLKRVREANGGLEVLQHRPAPGRHATLSVDQLSQLPTLIARGAAAYGFQGNRWTTSLVSAAIKLQFGVSYHPAHVSRLLRKYCPNWLEEQS